MDNLKNKTAEKPVANKSFVGSTFFNQLLHFVLTEYELVEVFNNLQFITVAKKVKQEREAIKRLTARKPEDPVNKDKKESSKTLNFTGKNSKHTRAFCEHIGKAVLAVSYFYRVTFKLKFDFNFPVMNKGPKYLKEYMHTVIDEIFVGRRYRIGKFNEFLVVCAFLTEVVVYMAFRREFAKTYIIWTYFSEIFCEALKEEFEEQGGWVLLKQVSRPWWKLYDKAKKEGILFNRPEYVYYAQDLTQWPYILFTSPKMIADMYEDTGDRSDIAYDPVNAKPRDMYKIACGSNGCYYFCLQKPKFESNALSIDERISNNLAAALAFIRYKDKIAIEKARRIKIIIAAAKSSALKNALARSLQSKCVISVPKVKAEPTAAFSGVVENSAVSPDISAASASTHSATKSPRAVKTGFTTVASPNAAKTGPTVASPNAAKTGPTVASPNAAKTGPTVASSDVAGTDSSASSFSAAAFSYELKTEKVPAFINYPPVYKIPEGFLSRNKVVRKYMDKLKEANDEVWNELDEFLDTLDLE